VLSGTVPAPRRLIPLPKPLLRGEPCRFPFGSHPTGAEEGETGYYQVDYIPVRHARAEAAVSSHPAACSTTTVPGGPKGAPPAKSRGG